MRKVSILLTTLVLASMLLVACGAEEPSTTIPNTTVSPEVPPITAEVTATDDGTSGTQPVGTETGVATETTTTPGTPGIPVTGEEDPSRLSD